VRFGVPLGIGVGVLFLEQQPLVALAAILHADDGELSLELVAVQAELEIAALHLRPGGKTPSVSVRAAVPQHDASRAIVAGRDVAFKIAVVEWMIFHMHGEALFGGAERGPLGTAQEASAPSISRRKS